MPIVRPLLGLFVLGMHSTVLSLPNYCHGVEFILYRTDTSDQIYRGFWLSGVDFDSSPFFKTPLDPGSYRVTAQFSSAASSLSGLPQRGCALIGSELSFSLDRTPQTIAQTRYLNFRSTVRDDDGPGFFSNDPAVLDFRCGLRGSSNQYRTVCGHTRPGILALDRYWARWVGL